MGAETVNRQADLVKQYVKYTGQSLFLTGKAGTGKTTLLRDILATNQKNAIVLAPTGVAAIQVGGSTIHSMFGFPLKVFIPSHEFTDGNIAVNKSLLLKHLRYNHQKRKLFQQLELLIIDEISMVRADLLDAIDFTLKYVRRNKEPFGGVQLLVVGDLFQLAPIVQNEEWNLLQRHYRHPYFYEAHSWKALGAFMIELETVYRQNDPEFLQILNHIRNGSIQDTLLKRLNQRYDPDFSDQNNDYIILTTHNHKADSINQQALSRIDAPQHQFKAVISGNFKESGFPVDETLRLKKGARVMFTRNDNEEGQYYNGKIGTVSKIEENMIQVESEDDLIEVSPVSWENTRYVLNEESNEIEQKVLGSFTQHPLRLAWAITIHKSQGLTFDKAIIDAGDSFAPGQAYVALSRCKTLSGIILKSRIQIQSIKTDQRVIHFLAQKDDFVSIEQDLAHYKKVYAYRQLKDLFNFTDVQEEILNWKAKIEDKKLPLPKKSDKLTSKIEGHTKELMAVQSQYQTYLKNKARKEKEVNDQKIYDKSHKAISYFTEQLYEDFIKPLHQHLEKISLKKNAKSYFKITYTLMKFLWSRIDELYGATYLGRPLYRGKRKYKADQLTDIKVDLVQQGSTYDKTLFLFRDEKSVEDIARIRALKESTIHSHLSYWVEKGEVDIEELMDMDKLYRIQEYIDAQEDPTLTELKSRIPFDTSYTELKYARAHFQSEPPQE